MSPKTIYKEPQATKSINIGSLTTFGAMVKKILGFEDGSLLKPSIINFFFAWLADNPLYFSDEILKFKF